MTSLQHAAHLHTEGYAVVEAAAPMGTAAARATARAEFLAAVRTSPEFLPGAEAFVMGGFAALANPSSFHNPFVRRLRRQAMDALLPLLRDYIRQFMPNPAEFKIEQVIDRMMLRHAGVSATAESWHRDEAVNVLDDDVVFGGWWNLSEHDQVFIGVPRTHTAVKGHGGFAPIKLAAQKDACDQAKQHIRIPPGAIFIFHENMIHAVNAKPAAHDAYRVFLGWRLTASDTPIHANIRQLLADQAVIPLKSGQVPPMYGSLHWTNWRDKIVAFTARNIRAVPGLVETRTVKSGKDAGTQVVVVVRHMPSLRFLAQAHPAVFRLFDPYTEDEIRMHLPTRY